MQKAPVTWASDRQCGVVREVAYGPKDGGPSLTLVRNATQALLRRCGRERCPSVPPARCEPLPQALITALQLTTFSDSAWCAIICNNPSDPSHLASCSHAAKVAQEALRVPGDLRFLVFLDFPFFVLDCSTFFLGNGVTKSLQTHYEEQP